MDGAKKFGAKHLKSNQIWLGSALISSTDGEVQEAKVKTLS